MIFPIAWPPRTLNANNLVPHPNSAPYSCGHIPRPCHYQQLQMVHNTNFKQSTLITTSYLCSSFLQGFFNPIGSTNPLTIPHLSVLTSFPIQFTFHKSHQNHFPAYTLTFSSSTVLFWKKENLHSIQFTTYFVLGPKKLNVNYVHSLILNIITKLN